MTHDLAGPLAERASIHDCWNKIGIAGDRSCPELSAHLHCRNCPVYSATATILLDKERPEAYEVDQSRFFSEKKKDQTQATQSILVFRIADEWLALPASCGVEVSEQRPIHSLPTHQSGVVLGLVNVRGELLVCVSLQRLLGLPQTAAVQDLSATAACPRMLVIQGQGGRLVIPVDEMHGMHRFHASQLRDLPATAAQADLNFATAILPWQDRMVACLDEQLLIYTLNRSLA